VKRTDPALWEAVKAEVTAQDKGGRPGQWSARKAQLAVFLYKKRGGGYLDPKDPTNSLARWTRQDWRTKSGRPSLVTGERYLPARAIEALTAQEYAATTKAKRHGMAQGKQFVSQPTHIAQKVAHYRRNEKEAEIKDEYLYHATHLGKLGAITQDGLQPSGGSQFSGGYDAHSRGRVFVTNYAGLPYWFNRMQDIAEYNSDFKTEDDVKEWTPIALRISTDNTIPYYDDAAGNRDNRVGSAYYTTQTIDPEWIEVWDGTAWVAIEDADVDGMGNDTIAAAEFEADESDGPDEDDYDEPEGYFSVAFDLFSPQRTAKKVKRFRRNSGPLPMDVTQGSVKKSFDGLCTYLMSGGDARKLPPILTALGRRRGNLELSTREVEALIRWFHAHISGG